MANILKLYLDIFSPKPWPAMDIISSLYKEKYPELKTLECDILNPDRIINLEIKNERRTSNI